MVCITLPLKASSMFSVSLRLKIPLFDAKPRVEEKTLRHSVLQKLMYLLACTCHGPRHQWTHLNGESHTALMANAHEQRADAVHVLPQKRQKSIALAGN